MIWRLALPDSCGFPDSSRVLRLESHKDSEYLSLLSLPKPLGIAAANNESRRETLKSKTSLIIYPRVPLRPFPIYFNYRLDRILDTRGARRD